MRHILWRPEQMWYRLHKALWEALFDWLATPVLRVFWDRDNVDQWPMRFYTWVGGNAYFCHERAQMHAAGLWPPKMGM